jgi:hypothetical protein
MKPDLDEVEIRVGADPGQQLRVELEERAQPQALAAACKGLRAG